MFLCCKKKSKIDLESQLNFVTNDDIPFFSFANNEFIIKILHVYDGDTFTGCFIYKNEIIKYHFRTLGYDSPEMKPLKTNPNRDQEKQLAIDARDKFIEFTNCENDLVRVVCDKFDKYGRILVTVFNQNNENINRKMIDTGHGKPYNGGTKEVWY